MKTKKRVDSASRKSRRKSGRCALAGGSISVSSANSLIEKWRKHASGCMGVARHHEKDGWAAEMASRAAGLRKSRREEKAKRAEAVEHEHDRYRWHRVAQTFRFCAKELRRQVVAANKRQPKSNVEMTGANSKKDTAPSVEVTPENPRA